MTIGQPNSKMVTALERGIIFVIFVYVNGAWPQNGFQIGETSSTHHLNDLYWSSRKLTQNLKFTNLQKTSLHSHNGNYATNYFQLTVNHIYVLLKQSSFRRFNVINFENIDDLQIMIKLLHFRLCKSLDYCTDHENVAQAWLTSLISHIHSLCAIALARWWYLSTLITSA